MITIQIGVTTKKINSTSRGFNGESVSVALKNKVSIKTPSFILNTDNLSGDIKDYNYLIWDSRYYWITNMSYINAKHVEIQANLDLLATYRDDLYNMPLYCKYTNNPGMYNNELDDIRFNPDYLHPIPAMDTTIYSKANIFSSKSDLWEDTGSGCIVMNTQSIIGTFSYLLSAQQWANWMDGMHQAGTSVVQLIAGFFGYESWTQCINSCIWYPIKYQKMLDYFSGGTNPKLTATKLYIGGVACDGVWGPDVDCYKFNWLSTINFKGALSIPRLADAPYFMWYNRWCTYQLATPFSTQDINADFCAVGHNYIPYSTMWDPSNGQINLKFTYDGNAFDDGEQTILGCYQGNIGTDIMSLVQTMQNWEEKLMTTIDLGLIAGGAAAGGVMLGSALGSSAAGAMTQSSVSMSNIIAANENPYGNTEGMSTAGKLNALNANISVADPANSAPAPTQDVDQAKNSSISLGPGIINVMSRAIPQTHNGASGSTGQGLAGLLNTTEFGLIKMRRKQFTAVELEQSGATVQQAYDNFCAKFGYPCNQLTTIYDCCYRMSPIEWDNTSVFVQGAIIARSGYLGCNQREVNAIEQIIANGIWIEN